MFFLVKLRNAQTFVSLHFHLSLKILLLLKASGETTGSIKVDHFSPFLIPINRPAYSGF